MRFTLLIATLAVAFPAAAALDLPKRKSGLWEMTMTHEGQQAQAGMPGGKMQMCIDEKIDDLAQQMGESAAREMCTKAEFRREGDRYVGNSVCKFNGTTATTRMVLTGRFDAEYQADLDTRFEPPMNGRGQSRMTIKGRWVGPCKQGQRPGDMVMPNGMTINMFDAQKGMPRK